MKSLAAEQIARLRTQFTPDNVFINTVVARDAHVVNGGLLAFANAHFKVDGIVHDVDFDRIKAVEDVAVVVILRTDSVFVFIEALVEQRLVIDVTRLHFERHVERIGREHCITHPLNASYIILVTLEEVDVDVNVLVVDVHDTVTQQEGVAIAPLVHLVDDEALVFLVFLGKEFFRLEKVQQGRFMRLLHGPFELLGLFRGHAGDTDVFHLDLRILLDMDVEQDTVIARDVIALYDVDGHVAISFFLKVALDDEFGAVYHVWCDLVAHP